MLKVLFEVVAFVAGVKVKLCWTHDPAVAIEGICTLPSTPFDADMREAVKLPEYDPLT
jgi:hypothetical protein